MQPVQVFVLVFLVFGLYFFLQSVQAVQVLAAVVVLSFVDIVFFVVFFVRTGVFKSMPDFLSGPASYGRSHG